MSLTLDHKAFIDILTEGQGDIGAVMQPPPDGLWGMPPELLKTLPGYDPDVEKSRAEARKLMEKLGYGPDKHLAVTVSTRNLAPYRDPGVILIDQLKQIYMDGVLDPVDTTNWYPKVMRKDYTVGLNITETAVDDPDPAFYENYVCGAMRNGRRAIGHERWRETQTVGVGDRKEIGRRRRAADPLLHSRGQLLLPEGQGARYPGQQHLQRPAIRGSLARPVEP